MNPDQFINLAQSILKIGGALLLARGTVTTSAWQQISGGVIAILGLYFSHTSNATPGAAASSAKAGGGAMRLILFCAFLVALCGGCIPSPSKAHIVRVVSTGTKFGLTQNPNTGIYELGLQRVQVEMTTVPVFWTNGIFSAPDAVMRYEVNTHSSIFGNAALTSTLATGTNAVNSSVGGATPPINASTGTGNNLTPALPH
jgi:hypothetical protein